MVKVTVTTRNGSTEIIEGENGISVMEAIRNAGIYELIAMCGGCCSCATCHVFVESGPEYLFKPETDDESDLLESSDYRRPNSRLSCQILLDDTLDGLSVRIAPED